MKAMLLNAVLVLLCLFPLATQAQWSPQTTSTTVNIHRSGYVGLGEPSPEAPLHISTVGKFEVDPDGKPSDIDDPVITNLVYPHHIRLDKAGELESYSWAIDGGVGLTFLRGQGGSYNREMSILQKGVRVYGQQVSIGNSSEQVNLGYGGIGNYLAFGYRPIGASGFIASGGGSGGSAIFGDNAGQFFIAASTGATLSASEDIKVAVLPSGMVGIGTATPAAKLTVMDKENATLRLANEVSHWDVKNDLASGEFWILQGSTPFVRCKADGRVAIGTSLTPDELDGGDTNIGAYRLYVEGGILTKEVRVRTDWADYVFAPGYDLQSLQEIEKHVAAHQHLPDFPSAKQIKAAGMAVGEITTLQQEKIEEIYLHLIELNKRLTQLEAENAALRAQLKQ